MQAWLDTHGAASVSQHLRRVSLPSKPNMQRGTSGSADNLNRERSPAGLPQCLADLFVHDHYNHYYSGCDTCEVCHSLQPIHTHKYRNTHTHTAHTHTHTPLKKVTICGFNSQHPLSSAKKLKSKNATQYLHARTPPHPPALTLARRRSWFNLCLLFSARYKFKYNIYIYK